MALEFHLFREENYRVFNICAIDKHNTTAAGLIKIQLINYISTVDIVGGENAGCFVCSSRRQQRTRVTNHKQITTLFSSRLSFDQKEKNVTLNKIFDGFRLIMIRQRHKIVPVG